MKLFFALLQFFFIPLCLVAQNDNINDFKPSGKTFGKIFSNFHTGLSDADKSSAFEITRAYFGYSYNMSKDFSATVKLDIGSPEDASPYSLLRRYAYFKVASLNYNKDALFVSFGLIELHHFQMQEKFWGHRYIYKSFQDEHKFGSSADIGLCLKYQLTDNISFDGSIINGEGYKRLQSDDTYKGTFGVTFNLANNLFTRIYYDLTIKSETQATYSGFLGYKIKKKYSLGIEYAYKYNNDFNCDNHKYGYSIYGDYFLNDKLEIFGRYDMLNSNKIDNEDCPWNLEKDGSAIIGGIQYSPIENVKIALNYQDWYPLAKNEDNLSYIFVNVEFSF
ncbi:MAG: hypothetical protein KAT68_12875 [Bacteroidales bacterium]|nr:hypothetical protein [Bacteroidales bacterium]